MAIRLMLFLALLVCAPHARAQSEQEMTPESRLEARRHLTAARAWLIAERPSGAVQHLLKLDPRDLDSAFTRSYAGGLLAVMAESMNYRFRGLPLDVLMARASEVREVRAHASYWEAKAFHSLGRFRIGEALEAWETTFTEHGATLPALKRAVAGLSLAKEGFRHDPSIQSGSLSPFLERWIEHPDEALLHELIRLEAYLDIEGEPVDRWLERLVVLDSGRAQSLLSRAQIQARRGRWDLALPWTLWAAHNSGRTSTVHSGANYWLLKVYENLGWCDLADDLADVWTELRPGGCESDASPASLAGHEICRQWHDWLMSYNPESLVRVAGRDWRSMVEDLGEWNARCSFIDYPLKTSGGACGSPMNTRTALRWLTDETYQRRHNNLSYPLEKEIDCITERSELLLPELFGSRLEGPDPNLDAVYLWKSRSRYEFRHGRVRQGRRSLQRALAGLDPQDRLQHFSELLDSISLHLLEESSEVRGAARDLFRIATQVLRERSRWHAENETQPDGSEGDWRSKVIKGTAFNLVVGVPDERSITQWLQWLSGWPETRTSIFAARGRLELERLRPDLALPWLVLAESRFQSEPRYRAAGFVPRPDLASTLSVFGWSWQELSNPDALADSKQFELEFPELEHQLPELCREKLFHLLQTPSSHPIWNEVDGWQRAEKLVKPYLSQCLLAKRELQELTRPLGESRFF